MVCQSHISIEQCSAVQFLQNTPAHLHLQQWNEQEYVGETAALICQISSPVSQ